MDQNFEFVFVTVILAIFLIFIEVYYEELTKLWDKIMEAMSGI